MAHKKKKNENSVTVDFKGVEASGAHPEGDWLMEVTKVEKKKSDSDNDYLSWELKGPHGKLFLNTSLQAHALFNLRGLLEAMGVEVPEAELDIDFKDMVGMEFIGTVEHRKYKGKTKSDVTDYTSAEGTTTDDGDEITIDGKGDGELDKLTEEEVGDMDVDELEEVNEKYGLDVKLKKHRSARKKVGAIIDALDEAGYLEED